MQFVSKAVRVTIVSVLVNELAMLRHRLRNEQKRKDYWRAKAQYWRAEAVRLNPDLADKRANNLRRKKRQPLRYATETERIAARRKTWRESSRRVRARKAA
jgi:hypothetical protein